MNSGVENGPLCCVLDLRERMFSFSLLSMMLYVGFYKFFFYQVGKFPFILSFLGVFLLTWMSAKFSLNVFLPLLRWSIWFFFFSLLKGWITSIDCWMVNQLYIPRVNPTWLYSILFIYWQIWFASVLLRVFASCSSDLYVYYNVCWILVLE